MLNMEPLTPPATTGTPVKWEMVLPDEPRFGLVTFIPSGFNQQIMDAVRDFIESSNFQAGIDKDGFYYQTLQAIANSAILGQGRDLWLGVRGGQLYTYILATISPDFDGKLCYMVNQAWVRKDQRGKPWVRQAWENVRQRAKDTLCNHFAVRSSKENTKAYCRFLGKGFHKVEEILKQEL